MQGFVLLAVSALYVAMKWKIISQKLFPSSEGSLLRQLLGPMTIALVTLAASYIVISKDGASIDAAPQTRLAYIATITSVLEVIEVLHSSAHIQQSGFHVIGAGMCASQIGIVGSSPWWIPLFVVHCGGYCKLLIQKDDEKTLDQNDA